MRNDPGAPVAGESSRPSWLKLSFIDIVALAATVGVLAALATPPVGDHDFAHRFPPPGPHLGDGLADVAGEYRQGSSPARNWRLSILADGRYSFIWSGCLGVYHRESGFASRVDEDVVLSPIKPIDTPMERTFRPLRWGARSYLIPPQRMQEFCDSIIRGDEPRGEVAGRFYLLGNEDRVDGTPELPQEWAAYLRENRGAGAGPIR